MAVPAPLLQGPLDEAVQLRKKATTGKSAGLWERGGVRGTFMDPEVGG